MWKHVQNVDSSRDYCRFLVKLVFYKVFEDEAGLVQLAPEYYEFLHKVLDVVLKSSSLPLIGKRIYYRYRKSSASPHFGQAFLSRLQLRAEPRHKLPRPSRRPGDPLQKVQAAGRPLVRLEGTAARHAPFLRFPVRKSLVPRAVHDVFQRNLQRSRDCQELPRTSQGTMHGQH